jgi:hypothetical protein
LGGPLRRATANPDGTITAATRLGLVTYRPAPHAMVQRIQLSKPVKFSMKADVAAAAAAAGAGPTLSEQAFERRFDTAVSELQLRGASTRVKGGEGMSKWAKLKALEERLLGYRERELRARRAAPVATAVQRALVMHSYRQARGARRLVDAVKDCRCEDIIAAVEVGAPANWVLNNGETLLTFLTHLHAAPFVARLVALGANPQKPNRDGWTPLMMAIHFGAEPMVHALLAAKADTEFGRWFGAGAAGPELAAAMPRGVRGEGVPRSVAPEHGAEYLTPIMYACALGRTGCVSALLRARANLRAVNPKGRTPAMFAARFRRVECMRTLCGDRLDAAPLDRAGFSALDWLRSAARERQLCDGTGQPPVGDVEGDAAVTEAVLTALDAFSRHGRKWVPLSALKNGKHVGRAVAATVGAVAMGSVEVELAQCLEDAGARFASHSSAITSRIVSMLSKDAADSRRKRRGQAKLAGLFGDVVKKRVGEGGILDLMLTSVRAARGVCAQHSLLALLAGASKRPALAVVASADAARHGEGGGGEHSSDDEFDDAEERAARAAALSFAASGKTREQRRLARSKIIPNIADFSAATILGEAPSSKRLPLKLGTARDRFKRALAELLADESNPEAFAALVAKRASGSAGTVLKLLPSAKLGATSASSGRQLAVVPLAHKTPSTVPILLQNPSSLQARGFEGTSIVPFAARERTAITVIVEQAMKPISSLLPVATGFNFQSPEAEAYADFEQGVDVLTKQAALLGSLRNALILYHKETLEKMGELAAPIVLMDQDSITPDDIGEYKAPTDPCDHCRSRRAAIRCINCAQSFCERCTLWLHKQPGMLHHRCKALLPKGLTEGKLMTRQARRIAAGKVDVQKLSAFPEYVERLRKIVRRVRARLAAAKAAELEGRAREAKTSGAMMALALATKKGATSGGSGGGGDGVADRSAAGPAATVSSPSPPAPVDAPAASSRPTSTGGVGGDDDDEFTGFVPPPPEVFTPASGPGEGTAPVKSSRVKAYSKWLLSVPGNAPPAVLDAAPPPPPPPPPADPYTPPPAVLAKLLGMSPNMSTWMGISLTPLFAPAPSAAALPPPPRHPEFKFAAAAAAAGGGGGGGSSVPPPARPPTAPAPAALAAPAAAPAPAPAPAAPPPPPSSISAPGSLVSPSSGPTGSTSSYYVVERTMPTKEDVRMVALFRMCPARAPLLTSPSPPPPPPPHTHKPLSTLRVPLQVPFMFFIRPRPDGQPGDYTAEVKAEAEAANVAAAARRGEEERALLGARWQRGLAVKAEALAAGATEREAAHAARAAMEEVAPSITEPFTPGADHRGPEEL